MKYSEKDLSALISKVETQFQEHLSKAETEEHEKIEKTEEVVKTASKKETSIKKTEKVVEAVAETKEFDYDDEDFAEMDKMYGSMTKSEAEVHYSSVKKAIFGEEKKVTKKIEKSEEVAEKIETKEKSDTSLTKTEEQVESLKKENDELKKNIEGLVGNLANFVKKGASAPKQKAITQIQYLAKSEDEEKKEEKAVEDVGKLEKAEVGRRLTAKIRDGKLEKADREAINDFYMGNKKDDIESIRHLL